MDEWEESKAAQNGWDIPHRTARIYSCKEQGVHIGSKTIQGANYHSALLVGRITTTEAHQDHHLGKQHIYDP